MAGGGEGGEDKRTTTTSTKRKPRKPRHKHKHLTPQILTLVSSATSAAHSFLLQHDLHLLPSQTLTIESHLSSLSLSLSSLGKPPRLLSPLPPPQCWFHRFLAAAADNYDRRWTHNLRLSKPSFSLLLRLISPFLLSSLPSIPPNYALAATLYRLAHGASYKAVARKFGFRSSADSCRVFYSVCKVINEKLGHLFQFHTDIDRIVVGFGWISLPNCCGVLGFGQFGVDGELLGPNGSLMVQALVDSEGRFLDISAGWPGKMKPETILHQTKLYLAIEESRELLNGPSYEISDGNSIRQHILGEACFPLLPWLITPYSRTNEEDSFSSLEKEFNLVHSRAMGLVSTAFGRVRMRWQLLSRRWKEESIEFFPFVIVTGCLLHNFLIKCGEPMPEENVGCLREEEELPAFEGEDAESGRRIRDSLASHLNRATYIFQGYEHHYNTKSQTMEYWFSWLSRSSLEPSLIYDYGLAFARNELREEDLIHFNHELLQSMGISIAKHRLEILKLAKKEVETGSRNNIHHLIFAIKKAKKSLSKSISKWISHGDSAIQAALEPLPPPPLPPLQPENWRGGALVRTHRSEDDLREERMVQRLRRPTQSGPLDGKVQDKLMLMNRSLKLSGPLDGRLFTNRSPKLSGPLDGRHINRSPRLSGPIDRQVNRSPKLSGPLDGRVGSPMVYGQLKTEKMDVCDDDDSSLWITLFQDMKPT